MSMSGRTVLDDGVCSETYLVGILIIYNEAIGGSLESAQIAD